MPREQAKIIHYERSQEFTRHFDYSATAGDKSRFKALDGRAIPRHVNRELCAPPPLDVDRLGHGVGLGSAERALKPDAHRLIPEEAPTSCVLPSDRRHILPFSSLRRRLPHPRSDAAGRCLSS